MAWIEAKHERTLEVDAPLDEVAEFFSDPSQIRHCMGDLDVGEEIDEQTWRWNMKEIGARNITFKGVHQVRYERDGDQVRWKSEGEGNMRTEGVARFSALDGESTRVEYEETMASDLPIPRLAAKVFRPIVAREVRRGIDEYLNNAVEYINAGRHRKDGES